MEKYDTENAIFYDYVKAYKEAHRYGDDSPQVEFALEEFIRHMQEKVGCIMTHQEAADELNYQLRYFPMSTSSYSKMNYIIERSKERA